MKKLKDIHWIPELQSIIFESDTPKGRAFDLIIELSIIASCLLIVAESVDSIKNNQRTLLSILEWMFLSVFTLEYLLRVFLERNRRRYMTSFFGIVDLLAILPAFVSFFIPEARLFVVIRVLRLLRLFSIFKMARYIQESGVLLKSLVQSRQKITVFLMTILYVVVIVGAFMYFIEGPDNGFNSIPESMYWAIVTVTTVGYGDISPQTPLGKLVASLLMIIAYGIIAVPTGIISYDMAMTARGLKISKKHDHHTYHDVDKSTPPLGVHDDGRHPHPSGTHDDGRHPVFDDIGVTHRGRSCSHCGNGHHLESAAFCCQCGYKLH